MKKIISLLLVFVFILSAGACSNNSVPEPEEAFTEENIIQTEITTTTKPVTQTTTEATTEPARLSEDCDKILATGYDNDGNYYELVGTEKQEYNGTIIKLGVIKNNEWLVPLTTDMPFIDENNGLIKYYYHKDGELSLKDIPSSGEYIKANDKKALYGIYYIGHGCFWSNAIIYNANNQKFSTYSPIVCTAGGAFYGSYLFNGIDTEIFIPSEGKYLVNRGKEILDVSTMETIPTGYQGNCSECGVCPYSEGVFACVCEYSNTDHSGFYNISGEKLIDLSGYNLNQINFDSEFGFGGYLTQALVFEKGEATFHILNDAGYEFEITMDKTGEVIKSVQITS